MEGRAIDSEHNFLTVINEHIFHNGGQIMHTPMKVLIAASNELPAKEEGLDGSVGPLSCAHGLKLH